jgi:hypothetical protein
VAQASARLEAASVELAARTEGAADRYTSALERWLALGGADLDARVGAALAAVGLEERHTELDCRRLSGGEAAKAGLAAVLLARFDIMLLDEPTNDLDLAGLHVLEGGRPDIVLLQETSAASFPRADPRRIRGRPSPSWRPQWCGDPQPGGSERGGHRLRSQGTLLSATCGGLRIHRVYVPNGHRLGTPHWYARLAWLARPAEYLATAGERPRWSPATGT